MRRLKITKFVCSVCAGLVAVTTANAQSTDETIWDEIINLPRPPAQYRLPQTQPQEWIAKTPSRQDLAPPIPKTYGPDNRSSRTGWGQASDQLGDKTLVQAPGKGQEESSVEELPAPRDGKQRSKPRRLAQPNTEQATPAAESIRAPEGRPALPTMDPRPSPDQLLGAAPPPQFVDPALSVKHILASVRNNSNGPINVVTWWTPHLEKSVREAPSSFPTGIDQLISLALRNSAQLQVFSEVPRIRQTAIVEADAAFDWSSFINTHWTDTNEPVGNVLTVGPGQDRFLDQKIDTDFGLRRRNKYGASVEVGQRFGHQDNNSQFFVPRDQGTSRLSLNFTQPLARGRGTIYNTSLTLLAQVDTMVARDEFERQMESHLLEVVRAYWALYLERGALTQKVNLYQHTKQLVDQLKRRQHIDTQFTQLVSAKAALSERTSELVRAEAAVKNAETRLRGLLNAPDLGTTDLVEIIPTERPTADLIGFELAGSMQTAIQYRSEVAQSIKQIKAGSVRLRMAKHEMLPVLNAVTEVYVSGLKGESRLDAAWKQQFTDGSPSYAVGLEYELPVGRRATSARLQRRNVEMRQLQSQYRNALETVKNEVEIAVREINTAFKEMNTKAVAMHSARQEAEALEHRWEQLANVNTSGALVLESLLRAQERTTQAEYDFLSAQLTYNLALIHIKRAMGVLVSIDKCGTIATTR